MGSRVVVTGATGFIGRSVVAALRDRGEEVTAVVRTPDRLEELPPVHGHAVRDVGPETDWSGVLDGADAVVHLAGRAHILRDTAPDRLAEFRRCNTEGSLRLAEAAVENGVRRFVFVSSIGVHGNESPGRPFTESDPPDPREDYAISKLEAEVGLRSLAAGTGMEVVVVRPPLVYGPGAPGNFARLVGMVRRGIPLPLASVRNRRSLVGLDNLVDFLLTCVVHAAAAGETFLVSDGEDLSTPELIRRLARAMDVSARLVPVPPIVLKAGARLTGQVGTARRLTGSLQVDISKARTVLGWEPPVDVERGLRMSVRDERP